MATRTTQNDLIRLRDAGWELCVLQVGPNLSSRVRKSGETKNFVI